MADFGALLSGFASGTAQGIEQQRLRDMFQAEQQQNALDQMLKLRQLGISEDRLGLDKERFGLEQDRLGLEAGRFGLDQQRFGLEAEKFGEEKRQFGVMEEGRAAARRLEERKFELEQRKQDLQTTKVLTEQLLNPALPKPMRKRIIQQWAPSLGLERDSQEYKDFEAMMLGLDEEGMQEVRSILSSVAGNAKPGEITGFALAVATGRLPLSEALSALDQRRISSLRASGGVDTSAPAGSAAPATPTTPPDAGSLRQRSLSLLNEANRLATAGDIEGANARRLEASELAEMASAMDRNVEFDPAAVQKRAEATATGERAAAKKAPLPASISDLWGFGSNDLTMGDAQSLGGFTDMLDTKSLKELRSFKTSAKSALRGIDELAGMVEGREELLGLAGRLVRGVESTVSTIEGLAATTGGLSALDPTKLERMKPVRDSLGDLARESRLIQSRVIEIAYQLAQAREGGRLSDQDFRRSLDSIGESASSEQFASTLRDLGARLQMTAVEKIRGESGVPPIDIMTTPGLFEYFKSVDDPRLLQFIDQELTRRLQ